MWGVVCFVGGCFGREDWRAVRRSGGCETGVTKALHYKASFLATQYRYRLVYIH